MRRQLCQEFIGWMRTIKENEDCKVEIAPLINCNCWKCRYQPPLPADQVKPMAEFDYEGGEVSINDLFFSLVQHSSQLFFGKFFDDCEEFSGSFFLYRFV
jgi:hypothetical protein